MVKQYCTEKNLYLDKHNFLGKGLWSQAYSKQEKETIT
jgi:hypothetical protein